MSPIMVIEKPSRPIFDTNKLMGNSCPVACHVNNWEPEFILYFNNMNAEENSWETLHRPITLCSSCNPPTRVII